MLTLDDAVKVAKELVEYGVDDEEIIRQELGQKCWFPPENDKAAKRLSGLISDINPAEVCSQIESDNLKNWCHRVQVEMRMAMARSYGSCGRADEEGERSMTWGDLYKQFCKKFPKLKAIDYRPFVEYYLPTHRPGIIVWLENGDVLVYIPKPEKE